MEARVIRRFRNDILLNGHISFTPKALLMKQSKICGKPMQLRDSSFLGILFRILVISGPGCLAKMARKPSATA